MKCFFLGGSKHGQVENLPQPKYSIVVLLANMPSSPIIENVPVPRPRHWWQRALAKLAGIPQTVANIAPPPLLYRETYNLVIFRSHWDPDQPDRMFGVYVLHGLQSKIALGDEVWSMAHYLGLPPPVARAVPGEYCNEP